VFDVDPAGAVTLLVPGPEWQENRVQEKRRYLLPRDNDQLELPVQGPPGTETLIAIASEHPLLIPTTWQSSGAVSQTELTVFVASLSRLPRTQWVIGQYQFGVSEK
jgi:hypothetical protein